MDINNINHFIETVGNGQLQAVLPVMQENANKLLALLAVIAVSWFGIEIAMAGGDVSDVLGGFIRKVFLIFLAFFFINDGYLLVFKNGVGDSLTFVSEQLLVGENINNAKSTFFGAGDALIDLVSKIVDESANPLSAMSNFFKSFPEIASLFLAWIFLQIAGMIFFAVAIASQLLIVVALTFGPVMIPWLVLPQTSKWFDGWFNFLVGAGFWKVIAASILGILSKTIVDFTNFMMSQIAVGLDNLPEILSSASVLIIVLLAAVFLFLQIPSLAGAISSGTGIHSIPSPRRFKSGGNSPSSPSNPPASPSGGSK